MEVLVNYLEAQFQPIVGAYNFTTQLSDIRIVQLTKLLGDIHMSGSRVNFHPPNDAISGLTYFKRNTILKAHITFLMYTYNYISSNFKHRIVVLIITSAL